MHNPAIVPECRQCYQGCVKIIFFIQKTMTIKAVQSLHSQRYLKVANFNAAMRLS